MGVRQALNTVYAQSVRGMDAKDRRQFDSDLNGWSAMNLKADQALRRGLADETGGGEG